MSKIKCLRNLVILCSLLIFFIGCRSTEIVWHDLRSDTSARFDIEIEFADADWNCIDIKLKRKSNSCRFIPEEYKWVGCSNSSNIVFQFYLPEDDHQKIELFVMDANKYEKITYDSVLDKLDTVLAYGIRFYDSELKRYCVLLSKDNIFNIDKENIYLDSNLTHADYLKMIHKGDVGYYEPVLTDDEKKTYLTVDSYSYYVESSIVEDCIFEISLLNDFLENSGEVCIGYYKDYIFNQE